jgi:DNA-binding transcriptional MerR regulator
VAARDDQLWTIEDLGNAVFAVLASEGPVQENGQIRDIPDRRTIRYYTTLGLIDRPAAMRGRTALYGRRHLEQLVAIKRLQSEGLTLAEVQARLAGLSPQKLRSLANVGEAPTKPETERTERSFWSEVPDLTPNEPEREPEPEPGPKQQHAKGHLSLSPGVLSGLPLAPNTILLIAPVRDLDDQDLRALQHAAEPLLRMLRSRGLIAEEREPV